MLLVLLANLGFEGSTTVSVPDVVGLSSAAAVSAITTAGLVAEITYAPSGSVASGDVISQSPAAATSVTAGSTVGIVVSTGASSGTIRVRKLRRLLRPFTTR